MPHPSLTDLLAEVLMPPLTITFVNPWLVKAYGQYFMGSTAKEAMDAADEYGEKHQLRAVSLIARPMSELV